MPHSYTFSSMDEKEPFNYMLCQNRDCEKAKECLRYVVYSGLTESDVSVKILNPLLFPKENAKCEYFRTIEKKQFAWGIKDFFDDLPYKAAKNIKSDMLSHFGHSRFYRFFREELPIMPKEQAEILHIFQKNGVTTSPKYTRFTDEYDW